jgi:hypothetical protein
MRQADDRTAVAKQRTRLERMGSTSTEGSASEPSDEQENQADRSKRQTPHKGGVRGTSGKRWTRSDNCAVRVRLAHVKAAFPDVSESWQSKSAGGVVALPFWPIVQKV